MRRTIIAAVLSAAACRSAPEPAPFAPGVGAAASQDWKKRFTAPRLSVVHAGRANAGRVLYASNEPGSFQLFGWDRASGERHQISTEPAGKRTGALTPDGTSVVYLRDAGGNEQGAYVSVPFAGGSGGAPAPLAADLPADIGAGGVDFAPDGSAAYVAGSHRDGYRVWRVAGGAPAQLLYRHANEAYGPAVSEDGALLAFIHSERKNDRHWIVRVVRAATGEAVGDLTDGPESTVTHAAWSPRRGDARLLVNSNSSGKARPSLWTPATGERRELNLAEMPGEVTGVDFIGAEHLLLEHDHEGRSRLWIYGLSDDELVPIPHPDGTVSGAVVLRDGTVLFNFSSGAVPPRVLQWDGAQVRAVLEPLANAPAGRPFQSVFFESSGGARIQAFLAEPPGPRPHPAVVYIHGGPGSQVEDAFSPTVQAMVDHGYAVLSVNYRGSTGYGREFTNVIEGDPGRLELDDLDTARRWLIAQGIARPDRIAARGASYGGYLTLMLLTRQPEAWWLGCSVVGIADLKLMYEDAREALRGWLRRYLGGTPDEKPALYAERSPIARIEALRAPLLIVHGRNDSRVPWRQMEVFVKRLEELKKPHEVMLFDGGHGTLRVEEQIEIEERFFAFAREHM